MAIASLRNLKDLIKSHKLSIKTKIKIFKAYTQSIFLYNSELWVTTKTIEDQIDSFQRRLLREVMGVKYPRIVRNEEVYEKSGMVKWSETIKKRRLSWLGHLLRLDEETPARKAIKEYVRKSLKKLFTRQKICWLDIIKKDFKHLNIKEEAKLIEELGKLSSDRQNWKNLITQHMMLNTTLHV